MKRHDLSNALVYILVCTVSMVTSQQCPAGCSCSATSIDCRGTHLQEIPDLSEYRWVAMTTMDFSYNKAIRVLMPYTFADINVKTLNLRKTGLTTFNRNVFENIASIDNLILDYNQVSYNSENTNFNGLHKLKSFSADYQGLTEIPTKLICDLKSIEELSFIGNSITSLHSLAIPASCKTLRIINLSKNALSYIEPSVFTRLNLPLVLDLRENALRDLGFLFSTCKFGYVYLDGNPNLECSCPFVSLNMHDRSMQLSGTCTIHSAVDEQTRELDLSTLREDAEDIAYFVCKNGPVRPPVNCGR